MFAVQTGWRMQQGECFRTNVCAHFFCKAKDVTHNSTLPLDFASWVGELIQPCAFLYKVLMSH